MKIDINNAVKHFYKDPSFEMVFFEAISNALDAKATSIDIKLSLDDLKCIKNLKLEIIDNGIGFTDERFGKFSELLCTNELTHKGIGRLVYLCYFSTVNITSYFNKTKKRTFKFATDFEGKSSVEDVSNRVSGTELLMENYFLTRIGKNNFLDASYLKKRIIEHFYSRLYIFYKLQNKTINISIHTSTGNKEKKENICTKDIPGFEVYHLPTNPIDLYNGIDMYYLIKEENDFNNRMLITAITIDDRTIPLDVISKENLPSTHDFVFLLYSESFRGKADDNRSSTTFSEGQKNMIINVFRKAIREVLNEKMPVIQKKNNKTYSNLIDRFPHLNGYISKDAVGYMPRLDVLKDAQEKFIKDQRDILDTDNLTEEQYQKSLDISSRSLAEYIVFRQLTINKLKKISPQQNESTSHNIMVPRYHEFKAQNIKYDFYRNNAWIFDDKFMTYSTILSEKDMTSLIDVITKGEVHDKDNDRPDIAIVFSTDPTKKNTKVDVVIIELKKKGLNINNNTTVEIQLEQRARKLSNYYDGVIQRVWYYGIVDIDDDYKLHLESSYSPLFSKGNVYYKPMSVVTEVKPRKEIIANVYIMDYKALIEDANARNATFLALFKDKFQEAKDSITKK